VGSFALVSVLLAALAHAGAGGALPDPWILLLGGLPVLVFAWPLAGAERRLPFILTGLAATQAWLHVWSSQLAGHSGHGSHGPAAAGPDADSWSAPIMIATHLIAGIVAGLWLRLGEERLWRLSRALVARVAAAVLVRRHRGLVPQHREPPIWAPPQQPRHPYPGWLSVAGMRAPPRSL